MATRYLIGVGLGISRYIFAVLFDAGGDRYR